MPTFLGVDPYLEGQEPTGLADFMSSSRELIVARWAECVRSTPQGERLSEPAIRDSVPQILDAIAETVRSSDPVDGEALEGLPDLHATHRLDLGIRLEDLLEELAMLRNIIIGLYREVACRDAGSVVAELGRFQLAMDALVRRSVSAYTHARERTLKALDRLSEAALGTGDVETFLPGLMRVLQETTEDIDTVTILLREGDRLRVRSSVGLEGEIEEQFSLAVGDGFAGTIAATRRPLLLHDASHDPLPRSRHLRKTGLRALYGVPLIEEGQVMGVAHIGSRTAYDFSEADKQLFRVMTERATSILVQAQLVEELKIREARLQRFVDADVVGVFFWRASGEITYANKAFLDLLGISLEDVTSGRIGWMSLSPPEYEASDRRLLAEALERGSHAPEEKAFFHADGRRIPVLIAATTYPDDPSQGVAFVLDLTAQKRSEAESRRLAEFRERLLGIVGHDLRNPLAAIRLGASVLLQRGELRAEAVRTVQRMSRSASRMERILGDLLDFTRIRIGGGLTVQPAPASATQVAGQAIEEVAATRPAAKIELDASGDDEGVFDSQRMVQLLVNLIDNAIKYGTPGTPVLVGVDGRRPEALRFSVHNEGPPIPPEAADTLFDPYRRVAREGDAESARSLGLGLYIVDRIARAHGGSAEFRSGADAGTTFTVTLPRRR